MNGPAMLPMPSVSLTASDILTERDLPRAIAADACSLASPNTHAQTSSHVGRGVPWGPNSPKTSSSSERINQWHPRLKEIA
jgi:hypothetical protein